jgi:hypothetical protein
LGVILIAVSLVVVAAPVANGSLPRYWSMAKVMRSIDGVRVRVGTRVVRIEGETTLCSGRGLSIRRAGVRRWTRFSCTFTTFTSRGVGRDVEFRVRVLGEKWFAIRDAHWVTTNR